MSNSEFLAGLIGPVLVVIAITMLTNRRALTAMAGQMPDNLAVVFLAGLLLLVAGLAIVRIHNVWSGGWPVIITIIGWLAIAGGLVRMLIPDQSAAMARQLAENRPLMSASGLVLLALGLYLSLLGYGVLG
jgi:predicted phage tail protein